MSSNKNNVRTICVIDGRWPVAPFNGQFPDLLDSSVTVFYQIVFEYKRDQIRPEHNQTVIIFDHQFTQKHAKSWGKANVESETAQDSVWADQARYIAQLVNYLIDLVQVTFDESSDNPFPHIRRIGIRDFVRVNIFGIDSQGNLQAGMTSLSLGQPALNGRLAERSIGLVSKVNFSTQNAMSSEKVRMTRAVELLNSGYHTEALLISFALLDRFVQDALEKVLLERGIDKPNRFLRRIPEQRLKTYLGPLLKILTGHSLEEDKPEVWENLEKVNKKRNDAIHDSRDISYEEAKRGIETSWDILQYLGAVPNAELEQVLDSSIMPDLGIERLPFLLEY